MKTLRKILVLPGVLLFLFTFALGGSLCTWQWRAMFGCARECLAKFWNR